MKNDIIKVIEEFKKSGKITDRYDMRASDILKIRENCRNDYDLITESFVLGFIRGCKAANAKKKKNKR